MSSPGANRVEWDGLMGNFGRFGVGKEDAIPLLSDSDSNWLNDDWWTLIGCKWKDGLVAGWSVIGWVIWMEICVVHCNNCLLLMWMCFYRDRLHGFQDWRVCSLNLEIRDLPTSCVWMTLDLDLLYCEYQQHPFLEMNSVPTSCFCWKSRERKNFLVTNPLPATVVFAVRYHLLKTSLKTLMST